MGMGMGMGSSGKKPLGGMMGGMMGMGSPMQPGASNNGLRMGMGMQQQAGGGGNAPVLGNISQLYQQAGASGGAARGGMGMMGMGMQGGGGGRAMGMSPGGGMMAGGARMGQQMQMQQMQMQRQVGAEIETYGRLSLECTILPCLIVCRLLSYLASPSHPLSHHHSSRCRCSRCRCGSSSSSSSSSREWATGRRREVETRSTSKLGKNSSFFWFDTNQPSTSRIATQRKNKGSKHLSRPHSSLLDNAHPYNAAC